MNLAHRMVAYLQQLFSRVLNLPAADMELHANSTESNEPLKVKYVDFHSDHNARTHHTDDFEVTETSKGGIPILRRGQPFVVTIDLNQQFNPKTHDIRLQFIFGTRGVRQFVIDVKDSVTFTKDDNQWDARILEKDGNQLRLQVHIPHDALVGEYNFKVLIMPENNQTAESVFSFDKLIHVLFNPWCEKDEVYLSNEEMIKEYVLNENGEVYVGTEHSFKSRHWYFGQFNYVFLQGISLMLQQGLDFRLRGDAVKMARSLAHKVNSTTRNGVLQGRWGSDYSGGTAPWKWTGSKKIMEEYLETGGPVQYGQCWVFSAFTTSVCRAIGIPCRSVTNFQSAHDSNASLTIDKYFDTNGEPIENTGRRNDGSNDSIWNFHVWNDVWMARSDLPEGYGGWQALDATPQERSEGIYTCGPCSVKAIKMGRIRLPYDANFIVGEVNADIVYWIMEDGEDPKPFSIDKDGTGKLLVTKSLRSNNLWSNHEDITSEYKYPEGSVEERAAFRLAVSGLEHLAHASLYESTKDVEFGVKVGQIMIGEDIVVKVNVHNTSNSARTLSANSTLSSMLYTGVEQHSVRKEKGDIMLDPYEKKTVEMRVKSDEYYPKLVEHCNLVFFTLIFVKETKQVLFKRKVFNLDKPVLEVKVSASGRVNKPVTVHLSFKNPLDRPITSLSFDIEGKGFEDVSGIFKGKVKPYGIFEHEVNIVPTRTGSVGLVATVSCNEIFDLTGKASINTGY